MSVTLPDLPYPKNSLAPHISEETINFHYGKHHLAYVNKLNALLEKDSSFAKADLEDMIKESTGAVFNNAAQIWNHTFYWNCLSPEGGGEPSQELANILTESFGSVEKFKEVFTAAALSQFGSGWAWLVKNSQGKLEVQAMGNAGNPLQNNSTPLLTCDVWEHAYYIDYKNARPAYLEAFWKLINWNFISNNLQK